jgi:uncharacterized protein
MPLPVTALYAAILALILTALAINVTVHRWRTRVPLGQSGNSLMLRMVRVHGNAAEYIPIALLLMAIYELNGGTRIVLHAFGSVLVLARLLHAWGLARTAAPSFGRAAGQLLTWLAIIVLALANLLKIL